MMHWLRSRLQNKEDGFTLVELMVVVLIIAILIAIAIPTFLGARQRAQDRAAQSDLRNGMAAAKVYYVDTEDYGNGEANDAAFATALEAIEPSLDFDAKANADTDTIGFIRGDQAVVFVRESQSGTFWCLADDTTSGTVQGSVASLAALTASTDCTGGW